MFKRALLVAAISALQISGVDACPKCDKKKPAAAKTCADLAPPTF